MRNKCCGLSVLVLAGIVFLFWPTTRESRMNVIFNGPSAHQYTAVLFNVVRLTGTPAGLAHTCGTSGVGCQVWFWLVLCFGFGQHQHGNRGLISYATGLLHTNTLQWCSNTVRWTGTPAGLAHTCGTSAVGSSVLVLAGFVFLFWPTTRESRMNIICNGPSAHQYTAVMLQHCPVDWNHCWFGTYMRIGTYMRNKCCGLVSFGFGWFCVLVLANNKGIQDECHI